METRKSNRNSRNHPTTGKSNRSTVNNRNGRNGQASGNRNKRRKKAPLPYQKIAIVGVFLMVVITCVVWATKATGKKVAETEPDETLVVIETDLQKEVMVDGIHITGMSREQAKEAILKQYEWDMRVLISESQKEFPVHNLMGDKLDLLLDEIFTQEPKETYSLDTSGLETFVVTEVERIAKEADTPAKNGSLIGFDKDNGSFIYAPEVRGTAIDQTKLVADLNSMIQEKNFDAVLTASMKATEPELTMAQAKQLYKVIGTFTTKTTSNKDRNTNIRIACEALDGLIIEPGAEFSFNLTTGNRTEQKGYRPAGAYVNGILVEEPGGGVCQVSSTLYNAVVYSGLTTIERHAHSFEPNYVTPGEDAMVSYDGFAGPDMRFKNISKDTVAIRAKFVDQTLTLSIVGIPVLESGVELKMKSSKTGELDPPVPVYEEDQSLEANVEVEVKAATKGSRWVTNLVTMKNGQIVSDVFLHNSSYKGKPATIKRNTSGVVVPKETESTAPTVPVDETETESQAQSLPQETENETKPITPNGPGATTAPTNSTQPDTSQGPGSTLPSESIPKTTVPVVPTQPESSANVIAPSPINP